jgi:hypothetical protein
MAKEKVQKDKEQLEDTTEVIKSRKLEKDRQYNNKMKRQKDKEKLEGTKEVIRSRQ